MMIYIVVALIIFVLALGAGFHAGRLYCADQCLTKGGFSFNEYDFSCLVTTRDNPFNGLPDVLRDPEDQDNGAFAENTLGKLKFLKPTAIQELSRAGAEAKPVRSFFGTGAEYDCVQCCKDADDIQSRMILCRECGNKRCPKAQNHRMQCTRSNEPGQYSLFDQSAPQQRLDGSNLVQSLDEREAMFN